MKYFKIICLAFVLTACGSEDGLNESIFIEDLDNLGLPIYSELGYNTFGFYYNSIPVTSSTWRDNPLQIKTEAGNSVFTFKGNSPTRANKLKLQMKDVVISAPEDLRDFAGQRIDLSTDDVVVQLGNNVDTLTVNSGSFEFSSIRVMTLDGQYEGIIASGTFELDGQLYSENISITNGRFDIRIDKYLIEVVE